jgi:mercuric ion binding protein
MRKLLIAALAAQPLAAMAAPSETIRFDVQNMTCPVCPITVKRSLEQLPDVSTRQGRFSREDGHCHQ